MPRTKGQEGGGYRRAAAACVAGLVAMSAPAFAQGRPHGYPRSYDQIIEKAGREASLIIYTNTHSRVASDVFHAFNKIYPNVKIHYIDGTAQDINERLLHEVASHHPTADLIWTSAVNLQAKLVNDGYAQVYNSPEKPALPNVAVWKDMAYGVSYEPIVIAYNRKLVPPGDVPTSHYDLTHLLQARSSVYRGRIATYDAEHSEYGRLELFHDLRATHETWDLVRALGQVAPKFFVTSDDMLNALAKGDVWITYNTVGSSALERQAHDPNIGVVLPQDYLLVSLPVALIPAEAAHPNAAKLFLDFILSRPGQEVLMRHNFSPVRLDLAANLRWRATDAGRIRVIRLGPSLLADMDQQNRAHLIKDWRHNLNLH